MNIHALWVGLAAMAMIVGLRRVAPKFPGLVVAVGLSSAVVAVAMLPFDTIFSRFGALPGTLPMPTLPDVSHGRTIELCPSAIVIAFLASAGSLLSAMVADKMIGGHHRPNAEVLAQGAANIGSALFGGSTATGAIARTAGECPRRRQAPRCRGRSRNNYSAGHAAGGTSCGLSRHARPC